MSADKPTRGLVKLEHVTTDISDDAYFHLHQEINRLNRKIDDLDFQIIHLDRSNLGRLRDLEYAREIMTELHKDCVRDSFDLGIIDCMFCGQSSKYHKHGCLSYEIDNFINLHFE